MGIERERYTMRPLGVNASSTIRGYSVAGFLAKTGGTVTLLGLDGITYVDAVAVTAGQYLPIPGMMQSPGGTFTLGGGASGTLFV